MQDLYLVDLIFSAQCQIKSLPKFHAVRWSAWFRFACHRALIDWETNFVGLLPFRNSQRPIYPGELLRVRLYLTDEGYKNLNELTRAIATTDERGEFTCKSLKLIALVDAVSGEVQNRSCRLTPFNIRYLSSEYEKLIELEIFTLCFYSPLRLTLPPGFKSSSEKETSRYAHEDFFEYPFALPHLCNSVRNFDAFLCEQDETSILSTDLIWEDPAYNENEHKKIGGLTGKITLGRIDSRDTAVKLIAGQYLGIGKNPRFALGYYKIPELDCARQIILPYSN